MTIIYPIGSFYPSQSGGPNNSIYWLTKELGKNNIHSIVITTSYGISISHNIVYNKWTNKHNVSTIYIKTRFHYVPIKAFIQTLKQIQKYDIIHLTNIFYPLSWMTAAYLSMFKANKIIWSIRGELSPSALKFSKWKKHPILNLIKILNRKQIIFHATSQQEYNHFKKHFINDNCVIIPNKILFYSSDFTRNDNQKYLLFVGRIHPIKALDKLIKGLCLSYEFINSNFVFKIVGDYNNNYGDELINIIAKNQLNNKIEFIGIKESKEKMELFKNAYFTFLVSESENFGNVILESLSMGTPVVASLNTPWEILPTSKAGFWISNKPQELSKIVDYILSMSDEEYQNYRRNAFNLANTKYNLATGINDWINLYNNKITNNNE